LDAVSELGVNVFAFSPDSRTLAWSGVRDPAIHIHELATGKERRELVGHRGQLRSLSFSADGAMLISASEDATALVWDLMGRSSTGRPKREPTRRELDAAWSALAGDDAPAAYAALRLLAASPTQSIPYLADHLTPADSGSRSKTTTPFSSPEALQALRAVESLELAATPEACKLLARLTGGDRDARLTQEAKSSLERLTKRKPDSR
jgi:hypothetical protein